VSKSPAKVRALELVQRRGETEEQALGRLSVSHGMDAAATICGYLPSCFKDADINALAGELAARTQAVQGADLASLESMLASQAETLSTIFHSTAQRAALNVGEYPKAAEMYLRLALKAQGQCRATVQTLAEMKNPRPVAFVQQANIAHGHQQVNNGFLDVTARTHARGETQNAPSKLMESNNGPWMDSGTSRAAVGSNQAVEAVGVLDRPAD
jgi:hypothetical protein